MVWHRACRGCPYAASGSKPRSGFDGVLALPNALTIAPSAALDPDVLPPKDDDDDEVPPKDDDDDNTVDSELRLLAGLIDEPCALEKSNNPTSARTCTDSSVNNAFGVASKPTTLASRIDPARTSCDSDVRSNRIAERTALTALLIDPISSSADCTDQAGAPATENADEKSVAIALWQRSAASSTACCVSTSADGCTSSPASMKVNENDTIPRRSTNCSRRRAWPSSATLIDLQARMHQRAGALHHQRRDEPLFLIQIIVANQESLDDKFRCLAPHVLAERQILERKLMRDRPATDAGIGRRDVEFNVAEFGNLQGFAEGQGEARTQG